MKKIDIHFEIGQNLKEEGTQSIFTSSSLIECLKEWQEKEYFKPEYFIDVWENNLPKAEININ